MILKVYK